MISIKGTHVFKTVCPGCFKNKSYKLQSKCLGGFYLHLLKVYTFKIFV